jgi:hypothetical protein
MRLGLTFRMTWASPSSMPKAWAGSIRASIHVRTRYFFAGGRARWPLVKEAACWAEADSTFAWMALMVVCWWAGYGLEKEVVCLRRQG